MNNAGNNSYKKKLPVSTSFVYLGNFKVSSQGFQLTLRFISVSWIFSVINVKITVCLKMERKPTDFYLQLSILKTPIGHVYLYHKTVRIVSLRGEHVLYVKD